MAAAAAGEPRAAGLPQALGAQALSDFVGGLAGPGLDRRVRQTLALLAQTAALADVLQFVTSTTPALLEHLCGQLEVLRTEKESLVRESKALRNQNMRMQTRFETYRTAARTCIGSVVSTDGLPDQPGADQQGADPSQLAPSSQRLRSQEHASPAAARAGDGPKTARSRLPSEPGQAGIEDTRPGVPATPPVAARARSTASPGLLKGGDPRPALPSPAASPSFSAATASGSCGKGTVIMDLSSGDTSGEEGVDDPDAAEEALGLGSKDIQACNGERAATARAAAGQTAHARPAGGAAAVGKAGASAQEGAEAAAAAAALSDSRPDSKPLEVQDRPPATPAAIGRGAGGSRRQPRWLAKAEAREALTEAGMEAGAEAPQQHSQEAAASSSASRGRSTDRTEEEPVLRSPDNSPMPKEAARAAQALRRSLQESKARHLERREAESEAEEARRHITRMQGEVRQREVEAEASRRSAALRDQQLFQTREVEAEALRAVEAEELHEFEASELRLAESEAQASEAEAIPLDMEAEAEALRMANSRKEVGTRDKRMPEWQQRRLAKLEELEEAEAAEETEAAEAKKLAAKLAGKPAGEPRKAQAALDRLAAHASVAAAAGEGRQLQPSEGSPPAVDGKAEPAEKVAGQTRPILPVKAIRPRAAQGSPEGEREAVANAAGAPGGGSLLRGQQVGLRSSGEVRPAGSPKTLTMQTPLWKLRKEAERHGDEQGVKTDAGLQAPPLPAVPPLPTAAPAAKQAAPREDDDHPLILAVEDANLLEVQRLLVEGTSPEVVNTKGETPLHRAAELGELNIAAVLLLSAADVNASDKVGNTPWAYAKNQTTEALLVLFGGTCLDDDDDAFTEEAGEKALNALEDPIRAMVKSKLKQAASNSSGPSGQSVPRWQQLKAQKKESPGSGSSTLSRSLHLGDDEQAVDSSTSSQILRASEEKVAPAAAEVPRPPASVTKEAEAPKEEERAQTVAKKAAQEAVKEEKVVELPEDCGLDFHDSDSGSEALEDKTRRGPWQVGDLEFSAAFDSGNCSRVASGSCRDLAAGERCFNVSVKPDCHGTMHEQVDCQWFYFRVSGALVEGQKLRFQVLGLSRFRNLGKTDVLERGIIEGMRPVINVTPRGRRPSLENWQFIANPAGIDSIADGVLSLTFRHTVQAAEAAKECDLYFAFTFPFPLFEVRRHLQGFAQKLLRSSAYVHREHLVRSLGGRPIELWTFTGPNGQQKGQLPPLAGLEDKGERPHAFAERRAVFISARVHPGETPASYILQGLLDFLASPSGIATDLMRRYVFHVVPMLNPDGVEIGHHRMDLLGVNLNRVYGSATLEKHPSVAAAEAVCASVHEHQNGLRLYLDLHAHSATRGVFLLGDAPDTEGQTLARLFGYALSRRCPIYEYAQSNFRESRSGTGKTWAISKTGVPLCFTVESNYGRGHHSSATFRPADWRRIGKACLQALWDMDRLQEPAPSSMQPAGLMQPTLEEMESARQWLRADLTAFSLKDRPVMLKVQGPSRALPKFCLVKAASADFKPSSVLLAHPELSGRCVEVIESFEPPLGSGEPCRCRLHEDDGGFILEETELIEQECQQKDVRYKALTTVTVSKGEIPSSEDFAILPKGTEVLVLERRVVGSRLRLQLDSGGWTSEYANMLFDPRLGGQPQLMRLEDKPQPVKHQEHAKPAVQSKQPRVEEHAKPAVQSKQPRVEEPAASRQLEKSAERASSKRSVAERAQADAAQPADNPTSKPLTRHARLRRERELASVASNGVVAGVLCQGNSIAFGAPVIGTSPSSSSRSGIGHPPQEAESLVASMAESVLQARPKSGISPSELARQGSGNRQGSRDRPPEGQPFFTHCGGSNQTPRGASSGPPPLPRPPPAATVPRGHWDLVFRQRNQVFSPLEFSRNAENPDADLFCRLDCLERYFGSDGKLALKMVFPRSDEPNCNTWKQQTNPVRMKRGEPVVGFEPLDLAYHRDGMKEHVFQGLQRSRSEAFLLHGYDPTNPDSCAYVVGSLSPCFSGPNGTDEICVELYALRPP